MARDDQTLVDIATLIGRDEGWLPADLVEQIQASADDTICVDFDNTLAQTGHYTPGVPEADPTRGALAAMRELIDRGYRLVILTARPTDDVRGWLAERGWDDLFDDVTNVKPPAVAYIDDRGLHYDGDWPDVLDEIEELAATIAAAGTPEGAKKAWDTRGRKQHEEKSPGRKAAETRQRNRERDEGIRPRNVSGPTTQDIKRFNEDLRQERRQGPRTAELKTTIAGVKVTIAGKGWHRDSFFMKGGDPTGKLQELVSKVLDERPAGLVKEMNGWQIQVVPMGRSGGWTGGAQWGMGRGVDVEGITRFDQRTIAINANTSPAPSYFLNTLSHEVGHVGFGAIVSEKTPAADKAFGKFFDASLKEGGISAYAQEYVRSVKESARTAGTTRTEQSKQADREMTAVNENFAEFHRFAREPGKLSAWSDKGYHPESVRAFRAMMAVLK